VIGSVLVTPSGSTKSIREEILKPGITPVAPVNIIMTANKKFFTLVGTKLGTNNISAAKLYCGTKV
jgi:hypothetical protein